MDNNLILSALQKFRPLFSYVTEMPDKLLSELASIIPSRHMIFPCDIIDLRLFLSKEKISFFIPLPVFSLRFAEKYLKEYSVFMVLDTHAIKADNYAYGGILLNLTDSLDISNSLLRLIVNEPVAEGSFNTVKQIIEELDIGVECLVSNSVPGISSPSQKLSIVHKKKYKVSQTQELYDSWKKSVDKPSIKLNREEEQIFEFLRQFKDVQMRVVGGWVRDKLKGEESDDIDIAVDQPGFELAQKIDAAAIKQGISKKPSARPADLVKTKDKSAPPVPGKLQVGSFNLYGQTIELVPMRTEIYPTKEKTPGYAEMTPGEKRTPIVKFTNNPLHDVKRRDLTINSIFYNIHTGQVEDPAGGIKDLGLDSGVMILKCPDDPDSTLLEDPIRALRVLRFHSRYPGSVVDPGILKAMSDPDVLQAYDDKIHPSRAGKEIRKMMEGKNPVSAIRMFLESGLYEVAFGLRGNPALHKDLLRMDQRSPHHEEDVLGHTMKVIENLQEILPPATDEESKRKKSLTMLAGIFHDFGKMNLEGQTLKKNNPAFPGHTQYINHEKESAKMVRKILTDIGATKGEKNFVEKLVDVHMMPHKSIDWMNSKKSPFGAGQFMEALKIKGKGGSDDMYEYAFYHSEADAQAGKSGFNKEEYDQSREWFRKHREDPAIAFTRVQGPVIRGDVVVSLFDNLVQEKGVKLDRRLINDTNQHLIKMQYKKNIDLSFASLPEGPERQIAMQNSQNDAMGKAKSYMGSVYTKYIIQTEPEVNAMGKNWFKKAVESPPLTELRSVPKDYDNDPEVKKGPAEARPKYYEGMKVRDRRKGMINPQEYGNVDAVKGNEVKIIWNPDNKEKKREEIFNMIEDTEILSLIVAEV